MFGCCFPDLSKRFGFILAQDVVLKLNLLHFILRFITGIIAS